MPSSKNPSRFLPDSPLQRRFSLVFVASALVPLALLTGVMTWITHHDVQKSVHREMRDKALEKQSRLTEHLNMVGLSAQALATMPPIEELLVKGEEASPETLQLAGELMHSYQEVHWGIFHHVMLANSQGEVILSPPHASAAHAHEGQNMSSLPDFSAALRGPLATGFFGFEETDHFHPLYMQPVHSGGRSVGVLILEVEIEHISKILEENAGFESAEVSLITLDGTEVVRSKVDMKPPVRNPTFDRAASTAGVFEGDLVDDSGENQLAVFVHESDYPWVLSFAVRRDEAHAAIAKVTNLGLITGLLGAVAVFLLALRLAGSYSRPLTELADTTQAIADGDLTRRVTVDGFGEIRDVQSALNEMTESWQEVISQVLSQSSSLTNAAGELEHVSGKLHKGVVTTKEQTASMSAASEEMSVTMSQVADSSSSVSSHVERSMHTVSKMSNGLEALLARAEEASKIAERISTVSRDNDDRVQELGCAAEEVGKVIDLIEDIADQTNLLALNATIEAARAGEAGKGFAVVATEVKNLAAQTSKASGEIRSEIERIRTSTDTAVTAVRGISTIVNEVQGIAHQIDDTVRTQTHSAEEVLRDMSESNRLMSALSRNVAESSMASKEIATGTSSVASTALSTADGANLASSSSKELSSMARGLGNLTSMFTV